MASDLFEECFDALQERFYIVVLSSQPDNIATYQVLSKRLTLIEAYQFFIQQIEKGEIPWYQRIYIAHYLDKATEIEVAAYNVEGTEVKIIKMPPRPKTRSLIL